MFKFLIILTCFVAYTQNVYSQQTINNAVPNISTDNIRYLFIGLDNPVTITTGCDEKYEVSISKGTLINNGNGHFMVRPGDTSEVIIKLKSGKREFNFLFHVRNIPDPEIVVGSFRSEQPILAFKTSAGVRAILWNFFYETQFNVVSFDIEFSGAGFDETSKHTNIGAQWDEESKKAINKMINGTKVYINKVRVLGPDGRVRLIYDDLTLIQK